MTRALLFATILAGCAPAPASMTTAQEDGRATSAADFARPGADLAQTAIVHDLGTAPDAAEVVDAAMAPAPDLAAPPDLATTCGTYLGPCCYHLEPLDAGGYHTVGSCMYAWVCRDNTTLGIWRCEM